MTRHDSRARLRHMLDHAREAWEMLRGKRRHDLDSDRLLGLALVRLLEIVGEAATRIPPEFRERHSHLPWNQIVALRHRLIHGYDAVDFDVLWTIVQSDIPVLIEQLDALMREDD